MPSVFPPPIAPTWDISQRRAEPPPFPELGLDSLNSLYGEERALPGEIPTPELPEEFDSSTFATRPSIPKVTAPEDFDDVEVSNSIVQNMENTVSRVLGDGSYGTSMRNDSEPTRTDPFENFGQPITFNEGRRREFQPGDPIKFTGFGGPSQMRGSALGGAYRSAGTPTVPNATARYYQRAANRGTRQDDIRVRRYLNRAPDQS